MDRRMQGSRAGHRAHVPEHRAVQSAWRCWTTSLTGRNLDAGDCLEPGDLAGRARRERLGEPREVEEVIDFLEIQHIRKDAGRRVFLRPAEARGMAGALAAERFDARCWTNRWRA